MQRDEYERRLTGKWDANTGRINEEGQYVENKEPFVVAENFWNVRRRNLHKETRGQICFGHIIVLAVILLFLLIGIILLSQKALADPPPGTDLQSPLHLWFSRLMEPENPTQGCCGWHKDCFETQARFVNGHWEAFYRPSRDDMQGARWIVVPDKAVNDDDHLPNHYNMAQEPILCAQTYVYEGDPAIFCYVPPATSY